MVVLLYVAWHVYLFLKGKYVLKNRGGVRIITDRSCGNGSWAAYPFAWRTTSITGFSWFVVSKYQLTTVDTTRGIESVADTIQTVRSLWDDEEVTCWRKVTTHRNNEETESLCTCVIRSLICRKWKCNMKMSVLNLFSCKRNANNNFELFQH